MVFREIIPATSEPKFLLSNLPTASSRASQPVYSALFGEIDYGGENFLSFGSKKGMSSDKFSKKKKKLKFYYLDEKGRLLVVFGPLSFYALYFHFTSFQSSCESLVRT